LIPFNWTSNSTAPFSSETDFEELERDVWVHFEGRNVSEVERMVGMLEGVRRQLGRTAVDGHGWATEHFSSAAEVVVSGGGGGGIASSRKGSWNQTLQSENVNVTVQEPSPTSSTLAYTATATATPNHAKTPHQPYRKPKFTISIEFEKNNRPGLDSLLPRADVLLFSKVYAEGKGFPGAPTGFLDNMRRECKPG
jgi:hypothetical protein